MKKTQDTRFNNNHLFRLLDIIHNDTMLYLVFEYLDIVSVCRIVLKHRSFCQDLVLITNEKPHRCITFNRICENTWMQRVKRE
jgi:hypothetical protein